MRSSLGWKSVSESMQMLGLKEAGDRLVKKQVID